MTKEERQLRLAIEDNIAWCAAVCVAHGGREARSDGIWANLNPSPPFYPNIITRARGAQAEVLAAIARFRSLHPSIRPAIKDSYADLTLLNHGFESVLQGDWYGHVPEIQIAGERQGWKRVSSSSELQRWEVAWNGGRGTAIFAESLLSDKRITFWQQTDGEEITSGLISFTSAMSLGLSNWFSCRPKPSLPVRAMELAITSSAGCPVVLWSTDDLATSDSRLRKLGPMQVWVQAPAAE